MAKHLGSGTLRDASQDRVHAPRTDPVLARHADRALCAILDISRATPIDHDQLKCLLSGNTASGRSIPGLQRRRSPSRSLGDALGLEPGELPDGPMMAMFARGLLADGNPMPIRDATSLLRRVNEAYGVERGRDPTAEEAANLAAGLFADGSPARGKKLRRVLHHRANSLAYRDFSFAADKSIAIIWAFGSDAERAIVLTAHLRAVEQTMADITALVGCARLGDSGRRGSIAGATIHVVMTHFTARKTNQGGTGAVPGDMHPHSHVIMLNIVRLPDGRLRRLNLRAIQGRIHEFGALYQARLATQLRRLGVAVALDVKRGCARATAISQQMIDRFSKRTMAGRASVEEHVLTNGVSLDDLPHRRRVSLLKQAVQGNPHVERRDDVADESAWSASLVDDEIGPIVDAGSAWSIPDETARIAMAARAAALVRDEALRARRPIGRREAAARGLIASGMTTVVDVDRVIALLDGETTDIDASASTLGIIDAKRTDGTAHLIVGGPDALLEAAVDRRHRLETSGTPARIVVHDHAEMIAATRLARDLRRRDGLLSEDLFRISVRPGHERQSTIDLAVGDIVVFGIHVNGHGTRGRVAAAGTPVTISAIRDDGLTVINARGRTASISRAALCGSRNDPIELSYGYAVVGPVEIVETAVFAATAGSRLLGGKHRPHDHLVFATSIEPMDSIDNDIAIERAWKAIAANLTEPSARPMLAVAESVRVLAEDAGLRGALLSERTRISHNILAPPPLSDVVCRSLARLADIVAGLVDRVQWRSRDAMRTANSNPAKAPSAAVAAKAHAGTAPSMTGASAEPAADLDRVVDLPASARPISETMPRDPSSTRHRARYGMTDARPATSAETPRHASAIVLHPFKRSASTDSDPVAALSSTSRTNSERIVHLAADVSKAPDEVIDAVAVLLRRAEPRSEAGLISKLVSRLAKAQTLSPQRFKSTVREDVEMNPSLSAVRYPGITLSGISPGAGLRAPSSRKVDATAVRDIKAAPATTVAKVPRPTSTDGAAVMVRPSALRASSDRIVHLAADISKAPDEAIDAVAVLLRRAGQRSEIRSISKLVTRVTEIIEQRVPISRSVNPLPGSSVVRDIVRLDPRAAELRQVASKSRTPSRTTDLGRHDDEAPPRHSSSEVIASVVLQQHNARGIDVDALSGRCDRRTVEMPNAEAQSDVTNTMAAQPGEASVSSDASASGRSVKASRENRAIKAEHRRGTQPRPPKAVPVRPGDFGFSIPSVSGRAEEGDAKTKSPSKATRRSPSRQLEAEKAKQIGASSQAAASITTASVATKRPYKKRRTSRRRQIER